MAHELLADFIYLLDHGSGRAAPDILLQRCIQLTEADAGALYVPRESADGRALLAVSVYGGAVDAERDAMAGRIFEERAPGVVREGGRSVLAIPLRNHPGEVVGILALCRGGPPYSQVEIDFLAPVNSVIGETLEREELRRRLAGSDEELRHRYRELERQKAHIEALSRETEAALRTSVTLLAKAAELHDEDTGNHILRVDRYAEALADRLGLANGFREEIAYSAALHDVGKMSVDAALLKKTGPLTLAERTEMERHTTYGYEILRQSDRLRMAAEIAWCHHERWDGGGYPRGIAGDTIPLSARIVAVGDVYDALRSPRPYKTARSHAVARDWMLQDVGHFDPAVIGCFADHDQDFEAIYEELVDRRKRSLD